MKRYQRCDRLMTNIMSWGATMDPETAERVWGGAIGINGMPRERQSSITNLKLKLVNRRTGRVRRRRIGNPLGGLFPIVTATGLFFSDNRVIPDRRRLLLKR
jgi:hypothetical protein